MCKTQDISNIPFIMSGNPFLVHGHKKHKKDLPHITCIFHLFKYVVKKCFSVAIFHHIFLLRLLPKSYFKISPFQPNFLCSNYFKILRLKKSEGHIINKNNCHKSYQQKSLNQYEKPSQLSCLFFHSQNRDQLSAAETGSGNKSGPPSMADVLKGLGTVKLKSVQR